MKGYPVLNRLLHWGMALMILVTIPVGIAMTSGGFSGIADVLYVTHKGLGVLIGVALVLRLLWRWVGPNPPPLPEAIPPVERVAARWTHRLLYLLVGAMALTGYFRTLGGGFPIEILDALGIPPLMGRNEALADRLSVMHKFLGYLTVATIAAHVGAVVQHTVFVRNGIFQRMWPPWRSDA